RALGHRLRRGDRRSGVPRRLLPRARDSLAPPRPPGRAGRRPERALVSETHAWRVHPAHQKGVGVAVWLSDQRPKRPRRAPVTDRSSSASVLLPSVSAPLSPKPVGSSDSAGDAIVEIGGGGVMVGTLVVVGVVDASRAGLVDVAPVPSSTR